MAEFASLTDGLHQVRSLSVELSRSGVWLIRVALCSQSIQTQLERVDRFKAAEAEIKALKS